MASFVMHYICGEELIKNLNISDYDKNMFRLGNLVVDTLGTSNYTREEKLKIKMVSHFRKGVYLDEPDIKYFINKYEKLLNSEYSSIGYLFHLYVDKMFFEWLYKSVIIRYDKDMNLCNNKEDVCYIKAINSGYLYTTGEFYSGSEIGLYSDYSKINRYLINRYKPYFDYDMFKEFIGLYFINPGIEEINYNNIMEVIDFMNNIINSDIKGELKIFKESDIDNFIKDVVSGFNKKYGKILLRK